MLDRLNALARDTAATVGLGMAADGDAAATSARRAEEEGLGPIDLYTDAGELARALASGRIDAAVRGTLGARDLLGGLMEAVGEGPVPLRRVALMVPGDRPPLLLAPVGIDEGRDLEERWSILRGAAGLLQDLGEAPRVAVMAMGRAEDVDRGRAISVSVRECEALTDAAEASGLEAECVGILLERALERANVVLAPDGVTGNLIFRALHYAAGVETWGAPALGLEPLVYVDTSRGRKDYTGAIKLARALAALRGHP